MENPTSDRCGRCDNCKKLDRVKTRVMACANPPFSSADDGVVAVWNDMLQLLPCQGLCPLCNKPLMPDITCHHCIQGLTEDQLDDALVHVVTERLTVAELIKYPAIYAELREEFKNETLDHAYSQLVETHLEGESHED